MIVHIEKGSKICRPKAEAVYYFDGGDFGITVLPERMELCVNMGCNVKTIIPLDKDTLGDLAKFFTKAAEIIEIKV